MDRALVDEESRDAAMPFTVGMVPVPHVATVEDEAVATFYRAGPAGIPTQTAFSQATRWATLDTDRSEGCIRSVEHAYSQEGGLAVLYGTSRLVLELDVPPGMPAMMTSMVSYPIDIVQTPARVALTGPDGRYRLDGRRIPVERTGSLEADLVRIMTLLSAHLESEIRTDPGQYLWLHNRWKTPPPEEPALGDTGTTPQGGREAAAS